MMVIHNTARLRRAVLCMTCVPGYYFLETFFATTFYITFFATGVASFATLGFRSFFGVSTDTISST